MSLLLVTLSAARASAASEWRACLLLTLSAAAARAGATSQEWSACLSVEFSAKRALDTRADGASTVAVGDLDADGHLDVVAGSAGDDTIAWFENDGAASPAFAKHVITEDADGVFSVGVSDVDSDFDLDVVSASWRDNTIAWYDNVGGTPRTFVKRVVATTVDGAYSVAAGDLDNDGDVDLMSASWNDYTIAWYQNDGANGFTKYVIDRRAVVPGSVTSADLDGDNDLDVLSTSAGDDTIAWYENDGKKNPTFSKRVISVEADGPWSIATADLDGDNDLDVMSASTVGDEIAWFENNAPETSFAGKRVIAGNAEWAQSVVGADVDGDNDVDVLSASAVDATVAWYENDGSASSPTFRKTVITDSAEWAQSVAAGDLDNDHDLDVISASADDNTIAWYANDCRTTDAVVPSAPAVPPSSSSSSSSSTGAADDDTDVLAIGLAVGAGVVLSVVGIALWRFFRGPRRHPNYRDHMIELKTAREFLLITTTEA